jgi:cobalt/nickel transport system ATP-binding protein
MMIKAEKLTVKYSPGDTKPALDSITLNLEQGEKLALIGANGAGKSTFLLTLSGVLLPSDGTLSVDGILMSKGNLKEIRRRVGLVFQNPDDQFFMPTVEDDIAFGPRNYGMDGKELKNRMDAILEKLGITGLRERSAHHLSGGEKRLAGLAGILIMEPSLLLMDEPSSFLDPRSRRNLISVLKELPQTMLIATHDLDMAQSLCPRAVLLKDGRIGADGETGKILGDSALLEECGL